MEKIPDSMLKANRIFKKKFLYPIARSSLKVSVGYINGSPVFKYAIKDGKNEYMDNLKNKLGIDFIAYREEFMKYMESLRSAESLEKFKNNQKAFYINGNFSIKPIFNMKYFDCFGQIADLINSESYSFINLHKRYVENKYNLSAMEAFGKISLEFIETLKCLKYNLEYANYSIDSETSELLKEAFNLDEFATTQDVEKFLKTKLDIALGDVEAGAKDLDLNGIISMSRFFEETTSNKLIDRGIPTRKPQPKLLSSQDLDKNELISGLFMNVPHLLPIVMSCGGDINYDMDPALFGDISLLNYLWAIGLVAVDHKNDENLTVDSFERVIYDKEGYGFSKHDESNSNLRKYFSDERGFCEYIKSVLRKVDPEGRVFDDNHPLFQLVDKDEYVSNGLEPGICKLEKRSRELENINNNEEEKYFFTNNYSIFKIGHQIDKILFDILYNVPTTHVSQRIVQSYDMMPMIQDIAKASIIFHLSTKYLNAIYRIRTMLNMTFNPGKMKCLSDANYTFNDLIELVYGVMFQNTIASADETAKKIVEEMAEIGTTLMGKNAQKWDDLLKSSSNDNEMVFVDHFKVGSKTPLAIDLDYCRPSLGVNLNIITGFDGVDAEHAAILERRKELSELVDNPKYKKLKRKLNLERKEMRSINPLTMGAKSAIEAGFMPRRDGSQTFLVKTNMSMEDLLLVDLAGNITYLQRNLSFNRINDMNDDRFSTEKTIIDFKSDVRSTVIFTLLTFDATNPEINNPNYQVFPTIVGQWEYHIPKHADCEPTYAENAGYFIFLSEEHYMDVMAKNGFTDPKEFVRNELLYREITEAGTIRDLPDNGTSQTIWNLDENVPIYTVKHKGISLIQPMYDSPKKTDIMNRHNISRSTLNDKNILKLYVVDINVGERDSCLDTDDDLGYKAKSTDVKDLVITKNMEDLPIGEPVFYLDEHELRIPVFHSRESAEKFIHKYGDMKTWLERKSDTSAKKQVFKEVTKEKFNLLTDTILVAVSTGISALITKIVIEKKKEGFDIMGALKDYRQVMQGLGKFRIDTSRKPAETAETLAKTVQNVRNMKISYEQFKANMAINQQKFQKDIIKMKEFHAAKVAAKQALITSVHAYQSKGLLNMMNAAMGSKALFKGFRGSLLGI